MTDAMQREDPVDEQAHPSLAAPVIILSGEIDAKSAAESASRIFSDPTWPTLRTVDCSNVTFFSAAGLSLLLRLANQRQIAIVSSPAVSRLVEICGLTEIFRVVNPSGLASEHDG